MRLVLFFLLLTIYSCQDKTDRRNIIENQTDPVIFHSKKLQDSLDLFLNSVDSIKNPYDLLPEFMIRCMKSGNDTLIYFHAAIEFTRAKDITPIQDVIKGGIIYNNKPVIVRYNGIENLSGIVLENLLDSLIGTQIDTIDSKFMNNTYSIWESYATRTEKKYKIINNDSLLLLRSYHLGNKVHQESMAK